MQCSAAVAVLLLIRWSVPARSMRR